MIDSLGHKLVERYCPSCGRNSYTRKEGMGFCSRSCSKKGTMNGLYQGKETLQNTDMRAYARAHAKVVRQRGKAVNCAWGCTHTRYEWANISQDYEDVWDYISLCKKCHVLLDLGKIELP